MHYNEPTVHLPGLPLGSKSIDRVAGKTIGYTARDWNAEHCFLLSTFSSSGLDTVAFRRLIEPELLQKRWKLHTAVYLATVARIVHIWLTRPWESSDEGGKDGNGEESEFREHVKMSEILR